MFLAEAEADLEFYIDFETLCFLLKFRNRCITDGVVESCNVPIRTEGGTVVVMSHSFFCFAGYYFFLFTRFFLYFDKPLIV